MLPISLSAMWCHEGNRSFPERFRLGCITALLILLVACGSSSNDRPGPLDDEDHFNLTDEQISVLPSDCLTAIDTLNIAYCFSPLDRNLMAVRPDGSTHWRFELPGSNDTNHIEHIAIIANTLILVTDVTVVTEQSVYEISRFETGGEFIETLPILEPFTRLRGDFAANSPVLNLGDQDLKVTTDNQALFVGAASYQLIFGGDPSQRSDWELTGSSLTKVNAITGKRTAYREFLTKQIDNIRLTDDSALTIVLDGVEQRFNTEDMSSVITNLDSPAFSRDSISTLVPYLYEELQAGYLQKLRTEILAIAQSISLPIEPLVPLCEHVEPAPSQADCFGEVTFGPILHSCTLSGSISETRYASTRFVSGTGESSSDTRSYAFDACVVDISSNDHLTDGQYLISGELELTDDSVAIRQGVRRLEEFKLTSIQLTYPDNTSVLTNARQTDTTTSTSFALIERDTVVEKYQYSAGDDLKIVSNLVFHSAQENHDEPTYFSVAGSMQHLSERSLNQTVMLWIDPAFENLYWLTDEVTLSGALHAESEDGSGITILAMENPEIPGDEQLHYYFGNTELPVFVKPFESLLIPFFTGN